MENFDEESYKQKAERLQREKALNLMAEHHKLNEIWRKEMHKYYKYVKQYFDLTFKMLDVSYRHDDEITVMLEPLHIAKTEMETRDYKAGQEIALKQIETCKQFLIKHNRTDIIDEWEKEIEQEGGKNEPR
jgi:hypothetical protein